MPIIEPIGPQNGVFIRVVANGYVVLVGQQMYGTIDETTTFCFRDFDSLTQWLSRNLTTPPKS